MLVLSNANSVAMRSRKGTGNPHRFVRVFSLNGAGYQGLVRTAEDGAGTTVLAGQAVIAEPGERVQYGRPAPEGAEYIAVCLPAFSPYTVNRDAG